MLDATTSQLMQAHNLESMHIYSASLYLCLSPQHMLRYSKPCGLKVVVREAAHLL
jgi:hypothetical protein